MFVWVGTALTISTADSRSAKSTAAESLKTVTTMAITAQQARADETLSLIRRGDEDVRKQSYYQRIDTMQQQLADYLGRDDAIDKADLADAEQLLRRWRAADDRINAYIAVGNYQAATQVALGTGEDDSTPAFDKLDAALTKGIEESRQQLRNDIVNARRGAVRRDGRRGGAQRHRGDRGGARAVAEVERVPMSERETELLAVRRRGGWCWPAAAQTAPVLDVPSVTLAPPTPAGMTEMPRRSPSQPPDTDRRRLHGEPAAVPRPRRRPTPPSATSATAAG